MKNNIFKIKKRSNFILSLVLMLFLVGTGSSFKSFSSPVVDQDLQKTEKIGRDETQILINDTDLYCSIFVRDGKPSDIKIIGAEREYEKNLYRDDDIVYINKGSADGLEPGHLFMVLEVGEKISDFGNIVLKRGRATVVALEKNGASAKIEKSCDGVKIGNYLVPFEPKEVVMGVDQGYGFSPQEGEGLKGEIVYLHTEYSQIGIGDWAFIDLGEKDGVQVGQQLVVYRRIKEGVPIQIFGNLVVIDVQDGSSTVKVLSCRDAIHLGDKVQAR